MQNECMTVKQSQTELHSFLVLFFSAPVFAYNACVFFKKETMDMVVLMSRR